jgi:hypothetical protein
MPRRKYGKERTYRKTYAERYIDTIMNDGKERNSHQVVDAIMTFIEESKTNTSFAYVPHKGKVAHYLANNNGYELISKSTKTGAIYKRKKLCESCSGSGYLKNKPCKECNGEEYDGKNKRVTE